MAKTVPFVKMENCEDRINMGNFLITASLIWIGLMLVAGVGEAYGPEKGGNKTGDSSDNGNDDELTKGPKRIDGVFDKVLQFDGTNNMVIQDHPTLDTKLKDGRCVGMWLTLHRIQGAPMVCVQGRLLHQSGCMRHGMLTPLKNYSS